LCNEILTSWIKAVVCRPPCSPSLVHGTCVFVLLTPMSANRYSKGSGDCWRAGLCLCSARYPASHR
jgi:hypothetical protein